MKLVVTQQLTDLDGNPLPQETKMRTIFVNALLADYKDEQNVSGEQKLERYELALRINAYDEVELKVEEAALLKKLVAKAYTPLVVGQAWKLIETAGKSMQ